MEEWSEHLFMLPVPLAPMSGTFQCSYVVRAQMFAPHHASRVKKSQARRRCSENVLYISQLYFREENLVLLYTQSFPQNFLLALLLFFGSNCK